MQPKAEWHEIHNNKNILAFIIKANEVNDKYHKSISCRPNALYATHNLFGLFGAFCTLGFSQNVQMLTAKGWEV